MCGRLDQNDVGRFLADFSWADEVLRRGSTAPTFDARPGTQRPILYIEDSQLVLDTRFWGYLGRNAPPGANRPVPNARLDKLLGRYWGRLARSRRVIVPANAWYEWVPEPDNPKKKHRWHIHRADGELLYMAGITQWEVTEKAHESGFVIVTSEAEGSMVDMHSRAPIVFTAADAATWLDPELSGEMAAELARNMALGPDTFAWFEVSSAVKDGPELARPLPPQVPTVDAQMGLL
ncbi:DUF159 family protein [Duganella sp. FT80W]|uniref:Abasic site processing protein n=1 Tax=Duganella guangzhouensis TaxID=2666084 RepID=A0A6I2KXH5_9BURK|nr:SOS response-associated peptidase family protein [Duganella guangzhouensis]MRW88886.1 DUF159 family protein [Duganella guangzhouensis]